MLRGRLFSPHLGVGVEWLEERPLVKVWKGKKKRGWGTEDLEGSKLAQGVGRRQAWVTDLSPSEA